MRRVGVTLAWCVFAVVPLAAQDALRTSRVFGIALREDGSPWGGARVQLTPDAAADGLPPRVGDTREVVADERGRFAFDVLPGRPCLVWATEALAGHRARVCRDVLRLEPGGRAELRAAPAVREPMRLRVLGVPESMQRPLRIERFEATTRLLESFELPADASVVLPARVTGPVTYRLYDASDRLLAHVEDASDEPELEVRLPPMAPLALRVVEAPAKLPLSGIRIESDLGLERRPLAVTDQDGLASVLPVMVGGRTPSGVRLAPARILAVRAGSLPLEVRVQKDAVAEVVVPPVEVAPPRVRFLADGRALAFARMRARASVAERRTASSRTTHFDEHMVIADEAGAIAFDAPVEARIDVEIECDEQVLRLFPPSWRAGAPPRITLGFYLAASVDHIELTERVRAIELGLLGPDGAPLGSAAVGIAPGGAGIQQTLVADRAGVVRCFLPIDHRTSTLVIVAGACGAGVVQVAPGVHPQHPLEPARLRATLLPVVQVSVHVGVGAQATMPSNVDVMAQWFPTSSNQALRLAAASPAELDAGILGSTEPALRVLDESATIRHLPKLLICRHQAAEATVLGVPALGGRLELRARGDTAKGVVWAKTTVDLDPKKAITAVELGFRR